MVVFSHSMDSVISEVFSKLIDSVIPWPALLPPKMQAQRDRALNSESCYLPSGFPKAYCTLRCHTHPCEYKGQCKHSPYTETFMPPVLQLQWHSVSNESSYKSKLSGTYLFRACKWSSYSSAPVRQPLLVPGIKSWHGTSKKCYQSRHGNESVTAENAWPIQERLWKTSLLCHHCVTPV